MGGDSIGALAGICRCKRMTDNGTRITPVDLRLLGGMAGSVGEGATCRIRREKNLGRGGPELDVASFCPLTWVVSVVEVQQECGSWQLQLLGGFELRGPEG